MKSYKSKESFRQAIIRGAEISETEDAVEGSAQGQASAPGIEGG